MKKILLTLCLLATTMVAQAQFEKGKWFINPSVTGLNLSYNTDTDKANFGLEANGGAFVANNIALLLNVGANWVGGGDDTYKLGVGGRYYIEQVGIYMGANVNVDRYDYGRGADHTKFSLGLEAGYAFFVSRTVTLEPAVYWNVNGDRSKIGVKLGFGFYF